MVLIAAATFGASQAVESIDGGAEIGYSLRSASMAMANLLACHIAHRIAKSNT